MELIKENPTQNIKLYKSRSIGIATFLGGPLAAGYLISKNYRSLNQPDAAKYALIIGVASTIVLFGAIFSLPDSIMENVPNSLLPAIYTAVILGLVQWKQGEILKQHQESGNTFFSGWKAAGVGIISLLILSVFILGYIFYSPQSKVYNQYDIEMANFTKNEEESLQFYDHIKINSNLSLIQEIKNVAIPKWKENIQMIQESSAIENLPSELIEQNRLLLEYSNLRIQTFKLMKKGMVENTDQYTAELDRVYLAIDKVLMELQ